MVAPVHRNQDLIGTAGPDRHRDGRGDLPQQRIGEGNPDGANDDIRILGIDNAGILPGGAKVRPRFEHGGGGGSREPAEMREAPVFRLPIVIERYGIEEYIIIDMAPFDPLSRFSRSFFTMIFMVCLFNLTFKVIGMWGDIVG